MEQKEIVLPRMDDMHFHPRDDDRITRMVMEHLLQSGFRRGITKTNFPKPIETAWDVDQDRKRLNDIAPEFEAIYCVMLNRNSTPEFIRDVYSTGVQIIAWIPDGLSTNSQNGVSWDNICEKYPCLREMEKLRMFLMVHMEESERDLNGRPITHPLFRESLALPKFDVLARAFPGIPMTIEHITTAETVEYIKGPAPSNVSGTITSKHLVGTIEDVYNFYWKIIPDQWCMPVFKFHRDRLALRYAATSGNKRFFFGSDIAPWRNKNPENPPAGICDSLTSACNVARVFEEHGALWRMSDFMSGFGADHYGLPRNGGRVVFRKENWIPPEEVDGVRIYGGGQKMEWRVVEVS